jgi:two-component system nitrogen regulation sensor histidine kinase NtrY
VATNHQLDERRRFTEAVLEGVTAGVIGLDAQRRIVLPNRSAVELLAPRRPDLAGVPIAEVFPEVVPLLDRLVAGRHDAVRGELTIRRGDRERHLVVRLAAQAHGGPATGYVLTFDDLTDLLSAQRQAAWAEVARRIAHEIKNPLTPIRLSAERLGRRFKAQIADPDRESFARSVTTIVQQVDTIGRLVGDFAAFARMPAATIKPASVAEIVEGAAQLQQPASGGAEIVVDLPAGDPLEIGCDADKLGQVLTNLIQNALNALAERPVPGRDPRIVIRATRRAPWLVVEVEDNGPGFPAGERARLFEPYVTTRTKGSGLGLAIVKKIMEEHRGTVDLENAADGGALVRLWLPLGSPDVGQDGIEPFGQALARRSKVA